MYWYSLSIYDLFCRIYYIGHFLFFYVVTDQGQPTYNQNTGMMFIRIKSIRTNKQSSFNNFFMTFSFSSVSVTNDPAAAAALRSSPTDPNPRKLSQLILRRLSSPCSKTRLFAHASLCRLAVSLSSSPSSPSSSAAPDAHPPPPLPFCYRLHLILHTLTSSLCDPSADIRRVSIKALYAWMVRFGGDVIAVTAETGRAVTLADIAWMVLSVAGATDECTENRVLVMRQIAEFCCGEGALSVEEKLRVIGVREWRQMFRKKVVGRERREEGGGENEDESNNNSNNSYDNSNDHHHPPFIFLRTAMTMMRLDGSYLLDEQRVTAEAIAVCSLCLCLCCVCLLLSLSFLLSLSLSLSSHRPAPSPPLLPPCTGTASSATPADCSHTLQMMSRVRVGWLLQCVCSRCVKW